MLKKLILSLLLIVSIQQVWAQKYLVVDNYNKKRERYFVGDDLYLSVRGEKKIFHDKILALTDSTITLENQNEELVLSEIDAIYLKRKWVTITSTGLGFIGFGFLFSGAVYPLLEDQRYEQDESFITGAAFVVAAAALQLKPIKYRKFDFTDGDRSRIRILDHTFDQQK
ncbi:hypothetical protein [Sediminitomix flava]|uniref:Uncharacterized protein n=1 Tax=Sediminitomix flava TaxID=379075 RepID=A0A315ZBF9_SEDFL|nr:hypothetical protein [Sediminitomix flava]PWJ42403.1 hypothetical protein BC781_103655 [Sediminitomix flava]